MEQKYINEELRAKTEKKFYGHNVLFSKYTPQIPASAEREYQRLANAYMKILKEELEAELPALKEVYKVERDAEVAENRRNDSMVDFFLAVRRLFSRIKNRVMVRVLSFGLERKLQQVALYSRRMTTNEFARACKATLGIDIRKDYYLGSFYEKQLEAWVKDNVDLIKTIPHDTLDRMEQLVLDGYVAGRTTTVMARDIQNAYGVSKRKAQLLARDQTAKLNGEIQRAQQLDAGITQYIWETSGDERVRRSHAALQGKVFSWNDPPVTEDGRRCHPGEDYNCRCIGRPVFNKNTLNIPVDDSDVKVTIK